MKNILTKVLLLTTLLTPIFIGYTYAEEDITLQIDSPEYNQILYDNEVTFLFSWYTPYTFQNYTYTISWYRNWKFYTWKYDTSWDINFQKNLEDGKYQFSVIMNYIDDKWDPWSKAQSEPFTVFDDVYLNITSPSSPVRSKNATFSWTWFADTFDHYNCTVHSDNAPYDTWFEIDSINNTSFNLSDLLEWNDYTFSVTIYYTWWRSITKTKDFRVNIQRSLTVSDISTIQQKSHTFTWNWSAEDFNNYTYTLESTDWDYYYTWGTTRNESFYVSDLIDWQYKLTVIMNCDWDTLTKSKTFDVDIDKSLSVWSDNPSWKYTGNNVTWVNVTINWSWDNDWFGGYNYTLTRDWNIHDTWASWAKVSSKVYEMLPSWTYNFHIDMISSTNSSVIITSGDVDFTVVIPTTLTINSPNVNWNSVILWRTWFAENFGYYEYSLDRTDIADNITWWTRNTYYTWFTIGWLHYWNYKLSVNMKNPWWTTITGKNTTFQISDQLSFSTSIQSWESIISSWDTINSKSATFTRSWQSEDLSWFYWEVSGTTFNDQPYISTWIQTWNIDWELYKTWSWSVTLSNLQTWRYRFTVKMLSWDDITTAFNEEYIDFNVSIPAYITITSPTSWATIKWSSTTFSWTWYSDVIEKYWYALSYWNQPVDTNNFTNSTSISSPTLKNWNYTLTVWIISWVNVAQDTVNFTVDIPQKSWWGSSSKTHYSNNLKLSIWNESPAANERIELIVKIDDKYTWKVSFPKLQYYSWNTERREDIPVTSKNFVADYSDDAKLWYVRFSSDDDWKKKLSQFIKFSKNWYYRIYAEDKDWYDEYVEFYVGKINNTTPKTETTTTNTWKDIDSIIKEYIPQILEDEDTDEEVYIARSCKKYTIKYSDTLMVYTSPNLNMSEYFMNKDYFKRYIDSKNKYQSGCPTNIWWISTSYSDKSNSDTRYTAPNGKVYFITWKEWSYYSEELNKELKTPTSFRTIQELKYYIRDRNPLISMAALWPIN